MKAISIPQPWAQLIARGFKTTFESRWELTAFPSRVLIFYEDTDEEIYSTKREIIEMAINHKFDKGFL